MATARAAVAIREGRRKRGEAFVTILRPPGRDFGPPFLMNVRSGRKIPAKTLHQLFLDGSCLAVINKTDSNQQNAFLMIVDSIVKRH
jgi:hypothetical protein